MDKKQLVKLIIANMIAAGQQDMIPVEWVDSWSDEECDYIIVNYGPYYLS